MHHSVHCCLKNVLGIRFYIYWINKHLLLKESTSVANLQDAQGHWPSNESRVCEKARPHSSGMPSIRDHTLSSTPVPYTPLALPISRMPIHQLLPHRLNQTQITNQVIGIKWGRLPMLNHGIPSLLGGTGALIHQRTVCFRCGQTTGSWRTRQPPGS